MYTRPPKHNSRGPRRDLFSRERMQKTKLFRMNEQDRHERGERDEARTQAAVKRNEMRNRAQEDIDRDDKDN